MWEKFKNIHHMFHVAVVFIFFPIAGVISGDYPLLTLLWTAIFIGAYYTILLSNHKMFQQISWLILLVYTFYSSIWLNSGFVWYIFYLSNLFIYHFKEMSFKSWRFGSFLTLQPLLLISLYMKNPVDISYLSFLLVTFLFSDLMIFGLHRIQLSE